MKGEENEKLREKFTKINHTTRRKCISLTNDEDLQTILVLYGI